MVMPGRTKAGRLCATAAITLMLAAGCGGDTSGRMDDWPLATPESRGLSTAALDLAAEKIRAIQFRYCLTVISGGELVYDQNYDRDPNGMYPGFSVTKTYMAVLVGIAAAQGYLSLDDRIDHWLDVLPGSMHQDATIRHVLGQVSQGNPPGSDFSYNTGAVIDTLGKVISRATGMASREYAKQQLLAPLNMQYTQWAADSAGNLKAGMGIASSCRDMARLGQLLLNQGAWQGQQLLAADYVDAMTRPSYPQANANHGYLTWLNWSEGKWYRPITSGSGTMLKGAPGNVFMATGFFGQLIIVVPDQDVVITTMGTTAVLETLGTLQKVWDAMQPALQPVADAVANAVEETVAEAVSPSPNKTPDMSKL